MKSRMLWAAVVMAMYFFLVILLAKPCAVAADPSLSKTQPPPPLITYTPSEDKSQQQINMTPAKPDVRRIPTIEREPEKRIDTSPRRACTSEPSCNGTTHVLSTRTCSEYLPEEEGCYLCELHAGFRSRAVCPEGWRDDLSDIVPGGYPGGVEWGVRSGLGSGVVPRIGFSCHSECFHQCSLELGWDYDACTARCPFLSGLKNPCPEGFDFFISNEYPARAHIYFSCFSHYEIGEVCGQCGSSQYGAMYPANGVVPCIQR